MIGVTLDSNVYIAALQFRDSRLLRIGRAGIIRIDTSDAILDETIGVLRDKFGWDGYRLHFARLELLKFVNRVSPTQTITAADDPDDDRIIECAVEAKSDYVVTWDKDLLRLREYAGIRIITPAQFVEKERES